MKIFVAGGTGAIGRLLVPMLVEEDHEVTALARSTRAAAKVEKMGASAVLADALDHDALQLAVVAAKPEVVIHQLTALAGTANLRRIDEEMAPTNRLRTEVTDTLLGAARAAGARRFIAQSYRGWVPAGAHPPARLRGLLDAIRHVEDAILGCTDLEALALRYGAFYGPGSVIAHDGMMVSMIRKRGFPVVGEGSGVWSFIHVGDAARATVAAVRRGKPGVYDIVDDEPAPVSAWLPALAEAVGAKPPRRIPVWLARLVIGEAGVAMMTRVKGGSNAEAKRELDWRPVYPTWRRGFVEGLD